MNPIIKKTKQRLMWLFALLTMLFLFLFVVIAYITVSRSVLSDQKEKVKEMVSDESIAHVLHEREEPRERVMNGNAMLFVTKDGEVIQQRGQNIEPLINEWMPSSLEIKEMDGTNGEFLIAAKPIGEAGYAYGGVNISQQKDVLKRLFIVLVLLTLVFTGVSMLLAFFISGRAIQPIIRSTKRQREFVNDASHELRTPLSILSAGFEVLESENKEQLTPFSKDTLQDMEGEVKRMTALVNDLLFLARSDSGKLPMNKQTFNLSELVIQSVRSFSRVADENKVNITTDVQQDVLFYGDETKIQQLLYVFLDNGVKYNQAGGSIKVELNTSNKNLTLKVIDTGIGIAVEHRSKIFERFYRVDKARAREKGSNGIGLSIAAFIVKAHEGIIQVESEEGEGTCFTLIFPDT
ncbi:ATP-binding protein [Halobacillus salinarum]|uniref:histidine kinase n=1 Tax=Halobacillus salinarum TaxID=2932257 RepID=A0ABY4ELT0_9BACI|nr:ATP-binding protein [Halobacillus salinarum]UOQ44552.1 ATP-binding protein [Halobacillus salinarum]